MKISTIHFKEKERVLIFLTLKDANLQSWKTEPREAKVIPRQRQHVTKALEQKKREVEQRLGIDLCGRRVFNKLGGGKSLFCFYEGGRRGTLSRKET